MGGCDAAGIPLPYTDGDTISARLDEWVAGGCTARLVHTHHVPSALRFGPP